MKIKNIYCQLVHYDFCDLTFIPGCKTKKAFSNSSKECIAYIEEFTSFYSVEQHISELNEETIKILFISN